MGSILVKLECAKYYPYILWSLDKMKRGVIRESKKNI